MQHQLVIQFQGEDFDTIVAIEDALIQHLGASAIVDGHDFGSGEANIFILTAEPLAVFLAAQEVLLKNSQFPRKYKAASRPIDGNNFTVHWPTGEAHFRVI